MSTITYLARGRADPSSGYLAEFVDMPECIAAGPDLGSLLSSARSALIEELERRRDTGALWPEPTAIENFSSEAGEFPVPVDVQMDDPAVRVNISLGERLLSRLDAAAVAQGMTRSGFIAQSVRRRLDSTAGVGQTFGANGRKLQDDINLLSRRVLEALGPESTFSRKMREFDDRVYDGVRRAADTVSSAMSQRLHERNPNPAPEDISGAGRPDEADARTSV